MCIGSIRLGVGEEESQSTATGARRHVGCGNSVDTTQAVGDGDHQSWVLEIRDATVDYDEVKLAQGMEVIVMFNVSTELDMANGARRHILVDMCLMREGSAGRKNSTVS